MSVIEEKQLKTERSIKRIKYYILLGVLAFINLTNLLAIVMFIIEDEMQVQTQEMFVLEAIVTVIFTIELFYNFYHAQKPKFAYWFK